MILLFALVCLFAFRCIWGYGLILQGVPVFVCFFGGFCCCHLLRECRSRSCDRSQALFDGSDVSLVIQLKLRRS